MASLVSGQVGFEVVLLDSKCYPVLHITSTVEFDFWKSSRKILAASKACFEKLTGKPFSGTIDISAHEAAAEGPPVKRKCSSGEHSKALSDKVEKVCATVEKIGKQMEFLKLFAKVFECIICRDIAKKPIVANCCQHLLGCQACVAKWFDESGNCPHCASSLNLARRIELKGMDEMLQLASLICEQKDHGNTESTSTPPAISDSDSDFEPPPTRFRRNPAN